MEISNTDQHITDDDDPVPSAAATAQGADAVSTESAPGARSHDAQDPPVSLMAALLEFLARLLSAQIPWVITQMKDGLTGLLHPQDGDGPNLQQRLDDARSRVVAWGREHPGQAVTVGASVLTAAIVFGILMHRRETAEPESPPPARATKRNTRRSRKRRKGRAGG